MLDGVCRRNGDLFFCSLEGPGVAYSNVEIAIAGLVSLLVVEAIKVGNLGTTES